MKKYGWIPTGKYRKFRPIFCSSQYESTINHRKISENFSDGILCLCSSYFRCFPAGYDDFSRIFPLDFRRPESSTWVLLFSQNVQFIGDFRHLNGLLYFPDDALCKNNRKNCHSLNQPELSVIKNVYDAIYFHYSSI
jgi:hypothetical protein